ncbi:MAG: pyridoxamine 5-phosphate oxidase family protein [Ilumatobacteraceae bacterium]|nr:pyridoxamine 5-phosphate oxidase family protein [Ilumatobacteraceae bacterium]
MNTARVELPEWESVELLGRSTIGRLCIIDHGYPLAFPLNYRMLTDVRPIRIVFRTDPRSVLAQYEGPASVEVDHVDPTARAAWSVIVRGNLRRSLDASEQRDTHPLVATGRLHWAVLDVVAISGRRFSAIEDNEGFTVDWQPVPLAV